MNVKRLTVMALLIALSAIGGLVKIPLGVGTAALDSLPALVSVVFSPPLYSGGIALFGHLASSMYVGFPFGLFHLIIAVEMFVILYIYAKLHRRGNPIVKWLFFVVGNGILATLPFYFLISPAFFLGSLPSILIATIVNASLAIILMPIIKRISTSWVGDL